MTKRLFGDESGQFAVITALLAVPVVGLMGLSIDYARSTGTASLLQNHGDAAALAMATQGPDGGEDSSLRYLSAFVEKQLADSGQLKNAEVEAGWTSDVDYTVTISGVVPPTLSGFIPGATNGMAVSIVSIARYRDITWKPPELASLDPEAGDYNRIYAYCFDPSKKNDPKTHGRSQEVPISDNGGRITYDMSQFPQCATGVVSYRLYNVRNSRTNQGNWDNPLAEHYNYYTDTVLNSQMGRDQDEEIAAGAERYDATTDGEAASRILETILCDTKEQCVPKSQGGILPSGKNRTPQRTTKACEPGKYMYYGWEDRPVGDKDYDDIRVIIQCPEISEEKNVRLIR
ncbi:TadE/TadG family type IV pilus assembly protein [Consotaella aegiceratis]|uniref:TadE/TadG family type IV pilus assembly protein n=1 Tax=Consotaella aegiceratis TaxID=3097961 RepID=UPI002F42EAA0